MVREETVGEIKVIRKEMATKKDFGVLKWMIAVGFTVLGIIATLLSIFH